jgi:hypothetical protein
MAPRDMRETRKAVLDELEQEWKNDPAYNGFDKMGNPVVKKSFTEYKQKHIEQRIKDWNRGFGDPIEDDLTPSELYENLPDSLQNANPVAPHVAQPANDGQPMEEQEDERPIVTNPAGRRAYLNPDGTVEPID